MTVAEVMEDMSVDAVTRSRWKVIGAEVSKRTDME